MRLNVDLEFACLTDPGKLRPHNEDSVAISAAYGLVILADGMGGYNAGEVASGMATVVLKNDLEADLERWHRELYKKHAEKLAALLQARIAHANSAIYQASQSYPQYAGMGTTLVVAVFRGNQLNLAHIGDSRAYRLRADKFEQITRDHSLLQEQLDSGLITPEQALLSNNKNLVTRALGIDASVIAEIQQLTTQAGDIYLFCSDGLSDLVSAQNMQNILTESSTNLESAAQKLIQSANDSGGHDNISAILVRVTPESAVDRGIFGRFRDWLN